MTVSDRTLLAEAVPDEELRAALLLELPGASDGALRFQQLTSPAMAKGVEDTALYRHHVLAARNEVGAHPGEPPGGAAAFQAAIASRSVAWPSAMAALGTHDSKRGPDVRARLLVLAELGEEWLAAVRHFEVLELDIRPDGAVEVDANARWLLWQTLVGAWPLELPSCRSSPIACGTTRSRRHARRRSARRGRSPTRPTRMRSSTWWRARSTRTALCSQRSGRSSSASRGPERSTACRSPSCSWRRPACRTSTRAPSGGHSPSWTRTIAAP